MRNKTYILLKLMEVDEMKDENSEYLPNPAVSMATGGHITKERFSEIIQKSLENSDSMINQQIREKLDGCFKPSLKVKKQ